MDPNNSQILETALKCGFAISTAHGIGKGQAMPISDSATLLAFAREVLRLAKQSGNV